MPEKRKKNLLKKVEKDPKDLVPKKEDTTPVYVIGHKQPDTDSICAAIAYANLKQKITGKKYIPARAGRLNEETRYVLKKTGVPEPMLLDDVRTQVKDIEIRRIAEASSDTSMKKAWERMKEADVVTLCILKGKSLEGLITTGDIVRSYMDIYDSDFVSKAGTSYQNILETLDGKMIVGSKEGCIEKGKVLIAAGSPEMLENFFESGDIVLVGNRYETQLCAIELDASLLVVCGNAEVANTIQKMAKEHGTRIIRTPYDTYSVARLINQSVPIHYFMKGDGLVYFRMNDYIEDIQDVMAQMRYRYFPILDENGDYAGRISRRNFLGAKRKKLILVDHNEKGQAVHGVESADIQEIIDHHRAASVQTLGPIYYRGEPLGSTCTIVYEMYREHGIEIEPKIAALMLSAILSDTLMYRSPTCTAVDKAAGEALARIAEIDVPSFAKAMFRAGSNLKNKTPEEILHQDFKKFSIEGTNFGIGQISSMNEDELSEIRTKIASCLEEERNQMGLDLMYFLLTNIINESSTVIWAGSAAPKILKTAFGQEMEKDCVILPGVVSRKKQFLPAITEVLQQI